MWHGKISPDAWHLRRGCTNWRTHRMIHVAEGTVWQVETRERWLRDLNAQRELVAQDCPGGAIVLGE
ncbi:MAG: hypothetical protein R3E08_08685 [Thiotrichaceae bacterium]